MVSKYDEFKNSKEFKLWGNIREVCETLNLRNENDVLSIEDLNEYWEPLMERIFKLGILFKQSGKLKEIQVDWMRPCFYIKTELEFVMDGKKYDPDKGSMQAAQKLGREFRYLIAFVMENYDRIDQTNFKVMKTDFQKKSSEFFKALIPYATKDSYRYMKANVKEILKPLLDLRKANYNLFILEAKEAGDAEITLFQNKSDIKEFMRRIGDHFTAEESKMKRDVEIDKLEEFMNKNMSTVFFEYAHQSKKREDGFTIEPHKFRKQALQVKFEDGFDKMMKYLYDKKKDDFFIQIDVHKLFKNIDLLGNNQLQCVKFYLDQEKVFISEMKVKLYEMKMNGLTRCKMPITKNEDLIQIIKKIYDMHHIVDYLMGDKLKYDQYVFFYNCIKFLNESSLKEELNTIKNKGFMEDAIPNYIILSAMRQAAIILEKMRVKSYCKNGQTFKWDDYYQIEKFPLDTEDDIIINAHEMNETMKKIYSNNPELKTTIERSQAEIKEFGERFWVLEGFFPVEDRKLWLEGIELLRNINVLVINDIRDFLLFNYEEASFKHRNNDRKSSKAGGKDNEPVVKKKDSRVKLIPSSKLLRASTFSNKKLGVSKGKKQLKNSINDISVDSEEDSIVQKPKIQPKLDNLRPPFVWNFPVEQFTLKKKNDQEERRTEIRNIDPVKFYSDGRVKRFLDILYKIKSNVISHSIEKKGQVWKFFFEKTLAIYNINYFYSYKRITTPNKIVDSSQINDSVTNLINISEI